VTWIVNMTLALAAAAASGQSPPPPTPAFALGADISWVPEQEAAGLRWSCRDTSGDIVTILADHGFDWIRLRTFVDPAAPDGYSAAGFCDLEHTLALAARAHAAGLRLLVDFHCSDTWADPAHQAKPAAWADLHGPALAEALRAHTREVVAALHRQGTPPDLVQVGNEISHGFLWPDGQVWATGDWHTFGNLLKAGINGVRDVDPELPVLLHLAGGGDNAASRAWLDRVLAEGVPCDVIGQSYYPRWHGTLADLRENLTDLAGRYRRPLAVVEYSAPDLREINEIVRGLPDGLGFGTFIWEPTRWQDGVLFDRQGRARPALDLYRELAREVAGSAAGGR
jgi:arabinogalactan endo-1,4-beta-galactosidase